MFAYLLFWGVLQVAALPGNAFAKQLSQNDGNGVNDSPLDISTKSSELEWKNPQEIIEADFSSSENSEQSEFSSALLNGIYSGNDSEVRRIIKTANVDINQVNLPGGISPLSLAVHLETPKVIRLLVLAGADIVDRDHYGDSILSFAIMEKGYDTIEALLCSRQRNVVAINSNGNRILFQAIQRGDSKIIQLLISKGFNVNAMNRHGDTPLLYSISKLRSPTQLSAYIRNTEIPKNYAESVIQTLIRGGANPNQSGPIGEKPLIMAARKGNINVVLLLLENGADKCNIGRVVKGIP